MMKFCHNDEQLSQRSNHCKDEFLLQWWVFIIMMNLPQHDQFTSHWWVLLQRFFFISIEILLHWWTFITMMNFYHNDKFSSPWWISIIMMNLHYNVYSSTFDEFSSQWCIFIKNICIIIIWNIHPLINFIPMMNILSQW